MGVGALADTLSPHFPLATVHSPPRLRCHHCCCLIASAALSARAVHPVSSLVVERCILFLPPVVVTLFLGFVEGWGGVCARRVREPRRLVSLCSFIQDCIMRK